MDQWYEKKVCVIGLGYIGLPTSAMFSMSGLFVTGVDISPAVVETINRGEIHIIEPGLATIVRQSVNSNKLRAVAKPEPADAFIIAVPTPFKKAKDATPKPDLSFVKAACASIAPLLKKGNLIVLESTSPIGTTEKICEWLSALRPDLVFPKNDDNMSDIFVAYCPERVIPGNIIYELSHNQRILGGITRRCSEVAVALYKTFVTGECHITNAKTAELAKLTENASRDVQIAFANELSLICDEHNINPWELIDLANKHPRVNILNPGPGVGGHCIAVDPWFVVDSSPVTSKIIQTARNINDTKPFWVVDKILRYCEKNEVHKIILLGASYKEDIDDVRQSPSLEIARILNLKSDIPVSFVEPNISAQYIHQHENIVLDNVNFQKDLCVALVRHKEFLELPEKPNQLIDIVGLFN